MSSATTAICRELPYRGGDLADGDLGYVVSFHDTRDQIATEERLTYLAHHDPLTDLPNRRLVSERLDYEISRARRYGDGFALHLIDLMTSRA